MTEYQKRVIAAALPTGTNTLGSIKVTDGTHTLDVASWGGLKTTLTDGTDYVVMASSGADGIATSLVGLTTHPKLYAFNGTSWDRLRCDTNKYLYTTLGTEIPAGTNLIGIFKIGDGTETATVTVDGYLDVATHSNHSGFSVSFGADAVNTTTGYVLIDLSDATNYPHTNTGKIHIDWIILTYLASSDAVGSVEVGFIKSITGSNADWYSLVKALLDKKEEERPIMLNFTPPCLTCSTTKHLSGGTQLHDDDATFQNDTALTATHATVIPAVGDLVAKVTLSAGSVGFVATVGYHTEAA